MILEQRILNVRTKAYGFTNISGELREIVARSSIRTGLCTVFVQHTSASLVIQENADPSVLRDLERWFSDLAPQARPWEHNDEGPDDMPAHARSALTKTSESIPIVEGALGLGTWQAVYLWEHRAHPHARRLVVTVQGKLDV